MSWRDTIKIHPAADMFPLMEGAEFDALVTDIKENGLHFPIILWQDDAAEQYVIDGRNRLRALIAAGIAPGQHHFNVVGLCESTRDPYALAVSLNIHRRHLNVEDRQNILIELIARMPERSNRQIAEDIGVDHKSVGRARSKGEDVGRIPHAEKRIDTKGRKQPARKTKPKVTTAAPGAEKQVDDIGAQDIAPSFSWGIEPRERCLMVVRAEILGEWLPKIPKAEYERFIQELQEEIDDIKRVINKRAGEEIDSPPTAPTTPSGTLVWTKDEWGNHLADVADRDYAIAALHGGYEITYLDRHRPRGDDGPVRTVLKKDVPDLDAAKKLVLKHANKIATPPRAPIAAVHAEREITAQPTALTANADGLDHYPELPAELDRRAKHEEAA